MLVDLDVNGERVVVSARRTHVGPDDCWMTVG